MQLIKAKEGEIKSNNSIMPLQNLYKKAYTGCPLGIDVTELVSGLQSDVSVVQSVPRYSSLLTPGPGTADCGMYTM